MANASYVEASFLGGEKSILAQGRIDERDYRTWMNVCLNGWTREAGSWTRRPGTMYGGHTRGGAVARVYRWDFAQTTPFTLEFTNGFIRFREGTRLATTNDPQSVTAISTANPAVVTTAGVNGWSTGNTITFNNNAPPLLQNRQFLITVIGSAAFSIADAITGAGIDGSTLGALPAGTVASRIQEIASPYSSNVWQNIRGTQAEDQMVLTVAGFPPFLLTAAPVPGLDAQFTLQPITFLDGPYMDPPINGAQIVASGSSGNITLTLQFPQFVSTQAYQKGSFVTSASVNFESLIDNNVGNTPASSPTAWQAVSAGVAVNNGKGFLGTDVGRLVRMFSAPALWDSTTSYSIGQTVSYNPSGEPGAAQFFTSIINANVGVVPGTNVNDWQSAPNAALWTWGKITGLGNAIGQALGSAIGDMTGGGGLSAPFNGIIAQNSSEGATFSVSGIDTGTIDAFTGKNFTGSPQKISSVTVFPATDIGSLNIQFTSASFFSEGLTSVNFSFNLRGSQNFPSSPSDGTLLGTSGNLAGPILTEGLITSSSAGLPFTIGSNDQNTSWNFVWVEAVGSFTTGGHVFGTFLLRASYAQMEFFAPPGTGASGNAVQVEILGPALLNPSVPMITWQLGTYCNTVGFPTIGSYYQGRIWFAGAVDNAFDASVSNGINGDTINMQPTAFDGTVADSNGISEVVNSDGVNPIFWFMPDQQGLLFGTQDGEWLIAAPSPGAIAPANIEATRVTKIGGAFIEPRRTDHTTIFIQRYQRKVMEYFADVFSGKFSAPNLAKDTMHITRPFVEEIAWIQAVDPIVFGRNDDGSWFGFTYKRDTLMTAQGPTINGWHRHQLGSGHSVVSIASGPSVGGDLDSLTMVTLDPTTGVYHVEVLTDAAEEGDTLIEATFLDDAINPTSTSTTNVPTAGAPYGGLTINGLTYLNGKTVSTWLGGLDCGDFVVNNGSIFVPYGDGISAGTGAGLFTAAFSATLTLSQMLVGFTFTSQGQIVRPATPQESGARNGPAVGKIRRNHKLAAQLEGAGVGISFGTRFDKLHPANFKSPGGTAFLVNQQFTGVYKNTLRDDDSFDGMICWQISRPYPANVANIAGFIETEDE